MAQVGSVRIEGCRTFLVQRSTIVVVYPPPDAFDGSKHLWLGTGMQGLTAQDCVQAAGVGLYFYDCFREHPSLYPFFVHKR